MFYFKDIDYRADLNDAIQNSRPLNAIEKLHNQLIKNIVAYPKQGISANVAVDLIHATMHDLNEIYGSFRRDYLDQSKAQKMITNMNFGKRVVIGPTIQVSIAESGLRMQDLLKTVINLHKQNVDFLLDEYYVICNTLVSDNAHNTSKSSFSITEDKILNLLVTKVITPHLDPDFKKIKDYLKIDPHGFILDLERNPHPEFILVDNLISKFNVLNTLPYSKLSDHFPEWYSQHAHLLEECHEKLSLYSAMHRLAINQYLDSKNIGNLKLSDILPSIKCVFTLAEYAKPMNDILDDLKKQADDLLKNHQTSYSKPRKRKNKKNVKNTRPTKSTTIAETEIKTVSESTIESTTISEPEFSLVIEKPVALEIANDSVMKPNIEITETKAEPTSGGRNSNSPFIPYFHHEASQDLKDCFKISNQKKNMIEEIYNVSKKIKYTKLASFIENELLGQIRTNGGSRHQFKALNQTVFFHKSHGKNRSKYITPPVVEDIKKMLIALAITPDSFQSASDNNMRNQNAPYVNFRMK